MASFADNTQYPVDSVKPQRCVMVHIKCAYTGKSGDCYDVVLTRLPGTIFEGILHLGSHSKNARLDCFRHCMENKIYPQNQLRKLLEEEHGTSDVSVVRTSGATETDWELDLSSAARHSSTYDEVIVSVTNSKQGVSKWISLSNFAEWNSLDIDAVTNRLVNSLHEFYSIGPDDVDN